MKKFIWCLLAIFVCSLSAFSQEAVPFNGLLLNGNGKGIKNVKIEIKGTERYTRTDKQGRFGLTNLHAEDVLVFTVKRIVHEVEVGQAKSLRIVLASDRNDDVEVSEDQELVDFGYMYFDRREYTGGASGITAEQLKNFTDLGDALNALVPNVVVDAEGAVIIRGQRSLNQSNSALILLNNGQEMYSIYDVSIYDIKSVEIIKDGEGYGSRGANGVIIIRTK